MEKMSVLRIHRIYQLDCSVRKAIVYINGVKKGTLAVGNSAEFQLKKSSKNSVRVVMFPFFTKKVELDGNHDVDLYLGLYYHTFIEALHPCSLKLLNYAESEAFKSSQSEKQPLLEGAYFKNMLLIGICSSVMIVVAALIESWADGRHVSLLYVFGLITLFGVFQTVRHRGRNMSLNLWLYPYLDSLSLVVIAGMMFHSVPILSVLFLLASVLFFLRWHPLFKKRKASAFL